MTLVTDLSCLLPCTVFTPSLSLQLCDTVCLSGLVIGSNSNRGSGSSGSSVSDHKLKLKETFSRQEKHIVRPGDRLSLKCVACGTPLPTITWNLDAFPVPETHRIQYGDYVRYAASPSSLLPSSPLSCLPSSCQQNECSRAATREPHHLVRPCYSSDAGIIVSVSTSE